MRILLRQGRVIDPASRTDRVADLYIAAGKIVSIGELPDGFHPDRVIDATGKVVAPGFVDLAARLREPGFEYKATLESEMRAAVAGGVTSLACPPDTDPVLDEPGLVEMLKFRARNLNLAHVYPIGALTLGLAGERLTEMAELTEAGCVAFSHADAPLANTTVLWRAMQYAKTFGFPIWLRPQDAYLAREGLAHDGEVATRLGLSGIPTSAELIALGTILQLVRAVGTRVHICRLSSADGVTMVAAAKREGLPVSCDVSTQHVHLCEMDIGYFDPHAHLVPPLRSQSDRAALARALADGTIDALTSDHTPVDEDGKQVPFGESEAGASGLELLLPLTLMWARDNKVNLMDALTRITSAPAKILEVEAGTLSLGGAADICIFAPAEHWRVEPAALCSQGKNTPFLGQEIPGRVHVTLVGGHVVFEFHAPG